MLAQILRRSVKHLPPSVLRILANQWRPFRASGIRISHVSNDYHYIRVEMKLRWYNKNYVGTHFGGSLYSMTDPFFMMMLINILGDDFIVWDKGACIDFIKPGRSTVHAEFHFSSEEIAHIRQQLQQQPKLIFQKTVYIVDESGENIAKADKMLYVRHKKPWPENVSSTKHSVSE
ncbi:MAG: DUF4442 domain-containing protein [Gammaproteobacteria bacterium]|nr:DUF4442 domain-containing protein [Gammaproteobacteria bacterium]